MAEGEPAPRLNLIAAVAANGTIGRGGELPWHLPADLKHFKAVTMGSALVMGRKTWESIGRPLPGRRSVVVTRQGGYDAQGAEVAGSLGEALALVSDAADVFVIGGASLYREALPRAHRLFLTHVDAEVEGDVAFPPFDQAAWEVAEERHYPADERNPYPLRFRVYARR